MQLKRIDLNCDMGELKPRQSGNFDAEIMPYISSCNIACGFHSGTPFLIEQTIRKAIEHGVAIGAHPSYDDRTNFGRKSINISLNNLIPQLRYQIAAIKGMVESLGHKLHHVKAHGALYNDMVKDNLLANAFVDLIQSIDPQLKIYALAHSNVIEICKTKNRIAVQEVFADRRYEQFNQLRNRDYADAVIEEPKEVLKQVGRFLKGTLTLSSGLITKINAESICLHSDTKGAIQLSETIYHFLKTNHVDISIP